MSTFVNDDGGVFLDEDDIIEEYDVDEEDRPDADSEDEMCDGVDDSIHKFTRHSGELYTVACSSYDATLVATGARDDKGFLWKIGQEDWAIELQDHKDSVSSVAFSSDGQMFASGSFDGVIKVWDISSSRLKCTLEGLDDIEWVRWHPQEHVVLAGSKKSSLLMWWNAENIAYYNTFSGHAKTVTCGDFTPDGKRICTGSKDASLSVWDPSTGKSIHVVRGHYYHTKGLTCLAITADSTRVLTGSKDGSVHIVNIATGKVVGSLMSHSDSIECVGLSASGAWAATGSTDKKLIIWDLQRSLARCTCEHEGGVTCLSWIGASRFVATGCMDWKVRIWDGLSGECVKTLKGHTDNIWSIAISAD